MFTTSVFTSNVCAFVRSRLVHACEYVCTLVCRDASGMWKLWGRWLSPCRGSTSPKRSRNNYFVAFSSTTKRWKWPFACLQQVMRCTQAVDVQCLFSGWMTVTSQWAIWWFWRSCCLTVPPWRSFLSGANIPTTAARGCSEETKQYLTVCLTRDCSVNNWINEGINK